MEALQNALLFVMLISGILAVLSVVADKLDG